MSTDFNIIKNKKTEFLKFLYNQIFSYICFNEKGRLTKLTKF